MGALDELQQHEGRRGSVTFSPAPQQQQQQQQQQQPVGQKPPAPPSYWLESPAPVPLQHLSRFQELINTTPVLCAYYLHQFEGIQQIDREKIKDQYRPTNVPKGFMRYEGRIYPYQENRVELPVYGEEDKTNSGGDFFNASRLAGLRANYVVSEAPTANAINAFYRMVWSQNVKIIVMLTGLVEPLDGKEWTAATQYWPISLHKARTRGTYSEYSIEMEAETSPTKSTKMRLLNITFHPSKLPKGGAVPEEKRQVILLHQSNWLDAMAPDMSDFKALMAEYRALRDSELKPDSAVLVHCSAGCGRSGMFVATDIMLDQLQQGECKEINVCEVTRQIRQARMGAVGTLEQYQFLYKVITTYTEQQPCTDEMRMYNFQALRQYNKYLGELRELNAYKTQQKLITSNQELLRALLKRYVHSQKTTLFYYWKALVQHLEVCFSEHSAFTEKLFSARLMVNIRDRGHVFKMSRLIRLVDTATDTWRREMSDADREAGVHTCELDIYACLSDILEMSTMLPYRNELVMGNSLDRLFWYRFFLREDKVPLERFANALRLFLLVQFEQKFIGGSSADFVLLLRSCMTTHHDPQPLYVTPRMWGHYLSRYGPISKCYNRMAGTSVPPGLPAPWFLPTFTDKQVDKFLLANSFAVRLSSDTSTFVLHIADKDPPTKIFLDDDGHYWDDLREQKDQRLANMRVLLYQYVVEKCEMFGTERKMLDDEQLAWRAFRGSGKHENEHRLKHQFTKTLCGAHAEPNFDKFLRTFPDCNHAEDIFVYLDLDLNTHLDSHELRVGLYLVFEPLVVELCQLATDKFEVEMSYRQLEQTFLGWLPLPSAVTYKVGELKTEMRHMAAKFYVYFLSHCVHVAKARQYHERFFSREVLRNFRGLSRARLATPEDAKQACEIPEDSYLTMREDQLRQRAAVAIQKCWRIFVRHKIDRDFSAWVNDVISNVVLEMKQSDSPPQSAFCAVIAHSILTIVFLPFFVVKATYASWRTKRRGILAETPSEAELVANARKEWCAQMQCFGAILVLLALYYLPIVAAILWVPTYDVTDHLLRQTHVTDLEVWVPIGIYIAVLLTVGVGFRDNPKMTPMRWHWEKASLIVGQSECSMRSRDGNPGPVSILQHVLPTALFAESQEDTAHVLRSVPGQVSYYLKYLSETYSNLGGQSSGSHVESVSEPNQPRKLVIHRGDHARKRHHYLLLCLFFAVCTAFGPAIYRVSHGGGFVGQSKDEYLAGISYIISTFASGFVFLVMLQASIHHYASAKTALQKVLDVTQPQQAFGKQGWSFYLPLDEQGVNLCFWVQLRQVAKDQVNSSVLFVVGLSLAAVIVAIVYNVIFFYVIARDDAELVDSINTIMGFWGTIVLSAHILWLVNIVVQMNMDVEMNTMRVLEEVRRDVVQSYNKLEVEASRHQRHSLELDVRRGYKSRHEILSKVQIRPITKDDFRACSDGTAADCEKEKRADMRDEIKRKVAFLALVDSAISEMKVLDERVTILGFTVNAEFRERALASVTAFVLSVVSQSLSLFGN